MGYRVYGNLIIIYPKPYAIWDYIATESWNVLELLVFESGSNPQKQLDPGWGEGRVLGFGV